MCHTFVSFHDPSAVFSGSDVQPGAVRHFQGGVECWGPVAYDASGKGILIYVGELKGFYYVLKPLATDCLW